MSAALPRIIVTSGEPAGIGPDICLALAEIQCDAQLVIAADLTLLQDRVGQLSRPCRLKAWQPGAPTPAQPGVLHVWHEPRAAPTDAGKLEPRNSHYVLKLLDMALTGIASGDFAAMVTAPVQKSVINEAGIPFSGHTEYLAEKLATPRPVMLLVSQQLRVALATTHLPLRAVADAIQPRLLDEVLAVIDNDLRHKWAISRPRIAVCGLNPHAGEGGHLGDEEQRIIAPAIERARHRGLDVYGPFPADTLFVARNLEPYDAVLAMYHDQGL
ncbi:MAG: 4-hydroxythreonine-4-phosphate dehydrogenase PdxA, partial [Pseudomonadales bacterium]|nr:4-hydroxythreonine-4-phosphate dehydrogenase PdxA [Pseudomonadales bacterium]